MSSKVFFTDFRSRTDKDNKLQKIKKLIDAVGMENVVKKDDLVTSGEIDWDKFWDFSSNGGTIYYSDRPEYKEIENLDPQDLLAHRFTFH